MSQVITKNEFQSCVLDSSVPVLVDFFATWCGPCRMVAPILEEVAKEIEGRGKIYKVDVDQSPDLAGVFGVMSVPTMILFENGQVKEQIIGARPKEALLSLFA